jgi:hypothetical protein
MRLILAFLFLLGAGFASATPLDDTINTMDTQLKDAIGKATTARTYVSSVKTSVLALEAQLATALSDLAAAQAASLQAAALAQTAQVQADFDAYKSMILQKFGPLGLVDWQKAEYRGYALDLSGFSEVFRSDFNDLSQISGPTGAGPWYSSVHSGFGGAGFVPIGGANDPYSIVNGALQIRVSHVGTVTNAGWYGGIIQTMRADGTGFALGLDAKAGVSAAHQAIAFRGEAEPPASRPGVCAMLRRTADVTAGSPAHGHWGSFWLLSAADYHNEITDFLIEQDVIESYGDDKGDHSTVHIKARKVPQPGDYSVSNRSWRASKALFSDPQTVVNTTGGAKTFPTSTTLGDGQFHTYTQVMDDQWITEYLDGFSIGRFPMLPEFRTPLYMLDQPHDLCRQGVVDRGAARHAGRLHQGAGEELTAERGRAGARLGWGKMALFEGWSRGEIATEVGLMVLGAALLVLAYCTTQDADAHDAPSGWTYGWECCSSMDCSQQAAASISEGSDGYTIKETGEVISYDDKRIKRSKDEYFHRCTHNADPKDPHSICLYVPDRGF